MIKKYKSSFTGEQIDKRLSGDFSEVKVVADGIEANNLSATNIESGNLTSSVGSIDSLTSQHVSSSAATIDSLTAKTISVDGIQNAIKKSADGNSLEIDLDEKDLILKTNDNFKLYGDEKGQIYTGNTLDIHSGSAMTIDSSYSDMSMSSKNLRIDASKDTFINTYGNMELNANNGSLKMSASGKGEISFGDTLKLNTKGTTTIDTAGKELKVSTGKQTNTHSGKLKTTVSGGDIELTTDSKMKLNSTGEFSIKSGSSKITLDSEQGKLSVNGSSKITATENEVILGEKKYSEIYYEGTYGWYDMSIQILNGEALEFEYTLDTGRKTDTTLYYGKDDTNLATIGIYNTSKNGTVESDIFNHRNFIIKTFINDGTATDGSDSYGYAKISNISTYNRSNPEIRFGEGVGYIITNNTFNTISIPLLTTKGVQTEGDLLVCAEDGSLTLKVTQGELKHSGKILADSLKIGNNSDNRYVEVTKEAKVNIGSDTKIGPFGKNSKGSTRPIHNSSPKGLQVNGSVKLKELQVGFQDYIDEDGNDTTRNDGEFKVYGTTNFYNETRIRSSLQVDSKINVKEGADIRGTLDMHSNDIQDVQSIKVKGTANFNNDTFSDKFKPMNDNVGKLGASDKHFAYGYINEVIFNNHEETNSCTIEVRDVDGASNCFNYNIDGYYHNSNQGEDNSYCLSKVVITNPYVFPVDIIVNYHQSSESGFDYGTLSELDTTFSLTNVVDPENIKVNCKDFYGIGNVTYVVPPGEHFFYAKYIKDYSEGDNDDTFKFQVYVSSEYSNFNVRDSAIGKVEDNTLLFPKGEAPSIIGTWKFNDWPELTGNNYSYQEYNCVAKDNYNNTINKIELHRDNYGHDIILRNAENEYPVIRIGETSLIYHIEINGVINQNKSITKSNYKLTIESCDEGLLDVFNGKGLIPGFPAQMYGRDMTAIQGKLEIIPDYKKIPSRLNPVENFDRLKFGSDEIVDDSGTTANTMLAYKRANSEGEVVPFAITKEGKVYYQGKEIGTSDAGGAGDPLYKITLDYEKDNCRFFATWYGTTDITGMSYEQISEAYGWNNYQGYILANGTVNAEIGVLNIIALELDRRQFIAFYKDEEGNIVDESIDFDSSAANWLCTKIASGVSTSGVNASGLYRHVLYISGNMPEGGDISAYMQLYNTSEKLIDTLDALKNELGDCAHYIPGGGHIYINNETRKIITGFYAEGSSLMINTVVDNNFTEGEIELTDDIINLTIFDDIKLVGSVSLTPAESSTNVLFEGSLPIVDNIEQFDDAVESLYNLYSQEELSNYKLFAMVGDVYISSSGGTDWSDCDTLTQVGLGTFKGDSLEFSFLATLNDHAVQILLSISPNGTTIYAIDSNGNFVGETNIAFAIDKLVGIK